MSDQPPNPQNERFGDDGVGLIIETPDGARYTFDEAGQRVDLPPRDPDGD